MIVADLPPIEQERIVCSIIAAQKFHIPADILLAIAEIEGGKPNLEVINVNKTRDIGYMQFNSSYLDELSTKYQYDFSEQANKSGCYSFYLAAWRIANHISNDKGSIWQRAANYHSRTDKYNLIYQNKLISKAQKWAFWLKQNFSIMEIT